MIVEQFGLWDNKPHPVQEFEVGQRVWVSARDWYGRSYTGTITRAQYLEMIYSWLYTVEFDDPEEIRGYNPEQRYDDTEMCKI